LGVHQSAQLIGAVAGGSYGGWAADHIGWREGFRTAAFAGMAYGGVLWLGIRKAGSTPGEAATKMAGSVGLLVRSAPYLAICGAFAGFCAMQWIFFAWFPTFLHERFGLSMTDSGWNGTVFVQTSAVIGILSGGALADRLHRHWPAARMGVAAIGVLLCAPFAFLTFSATDLNSARVCSAAFGLFGGLLAANAFAAAYDVVTSNSRGLAGGVLNMTGGLSSAITIYAAGVWKDTVGFAGLMIGVAVISVIAALVLLSASRNKSADRVTVTSH
jgi:sugar phosphate permease